ncbi:MAG TPA: DUF2892 domain-containing protein [Chlorobaculum sp.]|nr:DUF2892 domain-containing protein [Chlorobaculum sp.]
MKKNMGEKDRVFRLFLGTILLVYGVVFLNPVGIVGLIPLATGLSGYCPLYDLLGIKSFRFED